MYPRPTPAALIEHHQSEILNRWLELVIARVPPARLHGHSELVDHLQDLLNDIVQTLIALGPDAVPADVDILGCLGASSARHGRERATLEHYNVGDLVHEYALFRHVVTDFFNEDLPGDTLAADVITRVIEYSSLTSVNEFVRAIQEVQQKLIATLVHDVRTPLGVAYTYVEMLTHDQATAPLREQAVNTALRNLRRSVAMLEELLDVVKVKAGGGLLMRFEEDDLTRALRVVCTEASQIYHRRIESQLPDHAVVGVFDMAMVVRTVENLVSNAVKFGDREALIRISLDDAEDHVQVCVHNSGSPIPEGDRERIFSFFTSPGSERDIRGWGLGLSLIKAVAHSHGGEVIFSSSETSGTTFGMVLRKRFHKHGEELTTLL